ncbi:MAG TPA: hypothetical protein VF746_10505 [Longimicrobium sp.]|jgi:hypothetical protein
MELHRFARAAALCCAVASCLPPPLPAQRYGAGDEVAVAAVNAALGGLTTGVWRVVHGRRFTDGMLTGMAGGALGYAGKRVAVERFFGAGLLGREVGAVGASLVRNSADGRPALERVMLPLGPVRFYVTPREPAPVRVRLDATATAYAVYQAFRANHALDLEQSLSAGAVVFRVYGGGDGVYAGQEDAYTILLFYPAERRPLTPEERRAVGITAGHERVHVLQDDQMFLYVASPLEDRLLPARKGLLRHVDVGLATPLLWRGLSNLIEYEDRPWEDEAEILSLRR